MFIKAGSIGLLVGLLWVTLSCLSNTTDPKQAISIAMQNGDAHLLASYYDTEIALRIDPVGVDFPSVRASQAELIMRFFFRKYPPLRFQPIEEGSTTHLRYAIGIYRSGTRSFKVNVLLRQITPGQYRIHSIQVND